MIQANGFDEALDIVCAIIAEKNAVWSRIVSDSLGTTRRELSEVTGWSYSTVHRLCEHLEKCGDIRVNWNHQHQSYWEGHFQLNYGPYRKEPIGK